MNKVHLPRLQQASCKQAYRLPPGEPVNWPFVLRATEWRFIMKKVLLIVFVLILSISLFGCTGTGPVVRPDADSGQQDQQQTGKSDEEEIRKIVESFGSKLQEVSLQAPADLVVKSMQDSYGAFVTPGLLRKWQNDPLNAPGRLTSSPWPDRIEVKTVEKISEQQYQVKGEIIEITSAEKESGGIAAKRPVTLIVEKSGHGWLIGDVTLGAYDRADSVVYENTQYGFEFSLPVSWKGYTIITDKWEGLSIGDPQGEKVVESGPLISIRHPQWTSKNPRQDIPIMVFTIKQWDSLQQDKFHIGAAPIGPSELGRNSKYVFALPARYNYAFPTGYEEVENILKGKPLQPIDIKYTAE